MKFSLRSIAILSLFTVAACSSAVKDRKDQRDKLLQTSKMYCEFINGEIYTDIDVALNLEMAKRCDGDKPFTVTPYKTASENNGVIYCCSMKGSAFSAAKAVEKSEDAAPALAPAKKVEPKKEAPVAVPTKADADEEVSDVLKEALEKK